MNSSHTPNLAQQWAIFPEWAIASVMGIAVAIAGTVAFFRFRDQGTALMTKLGLSGRRKGQ